MSPKCLDKVQEKSPSPAGGSATSASLSSKLASKKIFPFSSFFFNCADVCTTTIRILLRYRRMSAPSPATAKKKSICAWTQQPWPTNPFFKRHKVEGFFSRRENMRGGAIGFQKLTNVGRIFLSRPSFYRALRTYMQNSFLFSLIIPYILFAIKVFPQRLFYGKLIKKDLRSDQTFFLFFFSFREIEWTARKKVTESRNGRRRGVFPPFAIISCVAGARRGKQEQTLLKDLRRR